MKLFTFSLSIGILFGLSFFSFAADMKNYASDIKEISVKYLVAKSFPGTGKYCKNLEDILSSGENFNDRSIKEVLDIFISINPTGAWPIFYSITWEKNDGSKVLYIFCRTKDLKHDIALIVEEKEALFILKNRSEVIKDIPKNLMKKIELKDIDGSTSNYDSPFELKNIEEYNKIDSSATPNSRIWFQGKLKQFFLCKCYFSRQ
ncbi:MAG: hypothetical protein A2017_02515 [Lentisphaerae bacterium GWF2_44_16]|nr:MAG: hypothetical protein A2017_02515 [Lentisphaerae bacterium GWF2_44_16]